MVSKGLYGSGGMRKEALSFWGGWHWQGVAGEEVGNGMGQ